MNRTESKLRWFLAGLGMLFLATIPCLAKPFEEPMRRMFPAPRVILFRFGIIKDGKPAAVRPENGFRSGQRFRMYVKSEWKKLHVRIFLFDSAGRFVPICGGPDPCATLTSAFHNMDLRVRKTG